MANPDLQGIESVIGSEAFQIARNNPVMLRRLLTLAGLGQNVGASDEAIERALAGLARNPGKAAYRRVELILVADGADLPDDILETGASAKELLDFAGGIEVLGGNGFEQLRDPAVLDKIRTMGADKALDEVGKRIAGSGFGVPDSVLNGLSLGKLLEGVGQAQAGGYDAVVSNPDYWRDYGKLSPDQLKNKWQAEAERMEAAARQRRQAERLRRAAELLQAVRDREARERQARERARQEKSRKTRRRRKPKVIIGEPVIVRKRKLVTTRVVHFGDGSTWTFRFYSDDSAEIVHTRADGVTRVCNKKPGPLYRRISKNPYTPVVVQVPDMVQCRAPARQPATLDGEGEPRGTAGLE